MKNQIHPTAVVHPDAVINQNVTIAAFTVIGPTVTIGENTTIGTHCSLGMDTGPAVEHSQDIAVDIGSGSIIRSHSTIYSGVVFKDALETGHGIVIREGTRGGRDIRIGTGCDIQGSVQFGDHVRLHSGVFVPQYSEIRDYVWIFPHAVLTNDPHPPSDECTRGPTIEEAAVIAARALVMPGVHVGAGSVVAAGSVVTRDVPSGYVVRGAPAVVICATEDVLCRHGKLSQVYPWQGRFRRGYV